MISFNSFTFALCGGNDLCDAHDAKAHMIRLNDIICFDLRLYLIKSYLTT